MADGLQPYPEYKDSGVDWLDDIPAHWDVEHGLAVFAPKQIKNLGMIEDTVLSLSYGRIIIKPPEKLHGLVPASFETYQIIDPGDIIIRGTDLQNDKTSLRVGIARDRGIITSAYLCLQTHGAMTPDYGHLLLHTYDLTKILYKFGTGLRQNLDYADFKRMPIIVPPPDEQDAIVRFLDDADRRIRRYIRAKRKLIALLNEQKQVFIQNAVTRGLNPDVPLKDSGIEWLGEIPAHWEALRSKYIYREINLRSSTGQETHLSMSQRLGLVPSSEISDYSLLSESYVNAKLVDIGDLVLNRLKAHLGVFALASQPGLVSPDYTVFRPIRSINNQFFEFVLRTPACRVELRQRAKGIVEGFWRLYTDDFYQIVLPIPPLGEQDAIVDQLQFDLEEIEGAINLAQSQIDLSREFHTRLIADVVTGKLDVRDAARHLPDEFDYEATDELEPDDMSAEEMADFADAAEEWDDD